MKKFVTVCLLLSLLLASCGSAVEETTNTTTTNDPTAAATETTAETADPYADTVEAEDFGGRDFHFLLYGTGAEIFIFCFTAQGQRSAGRCSM